MPAVLPGRASVTGSAAGSSGLGEYRSFEPYTKTPGRSSSGPRASRNGWTACVCAIESPVFTTRSGSRASRDLIQDRSRCRPGVRCTSERCRTRSGAAPAEGPAPRSAGGRTSSARRPTVAEAPHRQRPWARGPQGDSHPHMVPCPPSARPRLRRGAAARQDGSMAALKDRLRGDLTAAMKARDEVRTRTLRMALTSITREEVAGHPPGSSATTRSSTCSPGRRSSAARPPRRSRGGPRRSRPRGTGRGSGPGRLPARPAQRRGTRARWWRPHRGDRGERHGGDGAGHEGASRRRSRAGPTAPGSPPRSAASSPASGIIRQAGRCVPGELAPAAAVASARRPRRRHRCHCRSLLPPPPPSPPSPRLGLDLAWAWGWLGAMPVPIE